MIMGLEDRTVNVRIDIDAVRNGVVTICQTNSIANDASWTTFINGQTDAQIAQLCRAFFKTLINIKATGAG